MIHSRITAKSQTTVPQAVRRALGVGPGDDIGWKIENGRVTLVSLDDDEGLVSNFSTFTEWASEADCKAFDNL
jgi:antitoxin PrlF